LRRSINLTHPARAQGADDLIRDEPRANDVVRQPFPSTARI